MQIFLLIFLVTLALTMWARGKYRKAYGEEIKKVAASGITGAELAGRISPHCSRQALTIN